jgi:hypothetical protein
LDLVNEPGSASEVLKNLNKQTPRMISSETAVALIATCSLSQKDYQTIRNVSKAHGADIFPPYRKTLASKKECYPANAKFCETAAEQPLQDLVDHTAKRILDIDSVKESIVGSIEPDNCNQLSNGVLSMDIVLKSKWGFDGATGQSIYKQSFSCNDSSDACLYSVMFVPLDLKINRNVFLFFRDFL